MDNNINNFHIENMPNGLTRVRHIPSGLRGTYHSDTGAYHSGDLSGVEHLVQHHNKIPPIGSGGGSSHKYVSREGSPGEYQYKYQKSIPDGEDFGKPVPPRREGETEFQRYIRHYKDEGYENDQAVAIAAKQAGVSKKSMSEESLLDSLFKAETASMAESSKPKPPQGLTAKPQPSSGSGGHGAPGIGSMLVDHAAKWLTIRSMNAGNGCSLHGSSPCPDGCPNMRKGPFLNGLIAGAMIGYLTGNEKQEHTEKALSTTSGMIIPRLGVPPYDYSAIHRSANMMTPGMIPRMPTSMPMKAMSSKWCTMHGRNYSEDIGCHDCSMDKSLNCGSCGSPMQKTIGGEAICKRCYP